MANIQEFIAVADAEGDYSSYLVGDIRTKYGKDTELAMMMKIGDVHANHCGAKTSITKTVRPMSSFPKAQKRAFVVASDGVWDSVRLLQFGEFVLTKPTKTEMTIFIDREAQKTFGKNRDDFLINTSVQSSNTFLRGMIDRSGYYVPPNLQQYL